MTSPGELPIEANMAAGSIIGVGFVVLPLPRPWRLPPQVSRELTTLAAAMLLGMLLLTLCVDD
jgi:hypothetical protein